MGWAWLGVWWLLGRLCLAGEDCVTSELVGVMLVIGSWLGDSVCEVLGLVVVLEEDCVGEFLVKEV